MHVQCTQKFKCRRIHFEHNPETAGQNQGQTYVTKDRTPVPFMDVQRKEPQQGQFVVQARSTEITLFFLFFCIRLPLLVASVNQTGIPFISKGYYRF